MDGKVLSSLSTTCQKSRKKELEKEIRGSKRGTPFTQIQVRGGTAGRTGTVRAPPRSADIRFTTNSSPLPFPMLLIFVLLVSRYYDGTPTFR